MARAGKRPARSRAAPAPGEKLYYRIGEVSRITGVKPYVLRYWESEFRWMAPGKSRSQQRLYRQRDIEVIRLIQKLLYEERFTIAGARKRLRELGVAGAGESTASTASAEAEPVVAAEVVAKPPSRTAPVADEFLMARLARIREELEEIRSLL